MLLIAILNLASWPYVTTGFDTGVGVCSVQGRYKSTRSNSTTLHRCVPAKHAKIRIINCIIRISTDLLLGYDAMWAN